MIELRSRYRTSVPDLPAKEADQKTPQLFSTNRGCFVKEKVQKTAKAIKTVTPKIKSDI